MSWTCINCEATNDYGATNCVVCGYERYFSISEVNQLLEKQGGQPLDDKKMQRSIKRASADNKKLRQDNKNLIYKIHQLQEFYEKYHPQQQELERRSEQLLKTNTQLKIWLAILLLALFFFLFAKTSVQFQF